MFGIFGVRQVIMPEDISIVTILDSIFFILYFLVAFVVIIHFTKTIIVPKKEGKEKFYASNSSSKYHHATCKYINHKSKTVYSIYKNEEDAKADGRVPCKYCLRQHKNFSSKAI